MLSAAAEARIDAQGDAVQRALGFELVLVTVMDVPGTADELVMDLFARWKLGSIRARGRCWACGSRIARSGPVADRSGSGRQRAGDAPIYTRRTGALVPPGVGVVNSGR